MTEDGVAECDATVQLVVAKLPVAARAIFFIDSTSQDYLVLPI